MWWRGRPRQSSQRPDRFLSLARLEKSDGQPTARRGRWASPGRVGTGKLMTIGLSVVKRCRREPGAWATSTCGAAMAQLAGRVIVCRAGAANSYFALVSSAVQGCMSVRVNQWHANHAETDVLFMGSWSSGWPGQDASGHRSVGVVAPFAPHPVNTTRPTCGGDRNVDRVEFADSAYGQPARKHGCSGWGTAPVRDSHHTRRRPHRDRWVCWVSAMIFSASIDKPR